MVANCGHDENNQYHGGKAGDQTGTEWQIRSWYNGKWDVVLRYPDKKVADKIAELAELAAKNDMIGYDQWQRQTYWKALVAAGYNPRAIKTPCEADCSSGVCANVKATGELLNIAKLKELNENLRTATMLAAFKAAGFMALTDTKYLTSDKYLKRGDILLRIGHHTTTNITDGKLAYTDTQPKESYGMKTIKKGSKGKAVEIWQVICGAKIDGDFGTETEKKTKDFQKAHGLEIDGIVGKYTWGEGFASV